MTVSPIDDIQARISEIQTRIYGARPPAADAARATSTNGTSFATALSGALGSTSTTAGSSSGTTGQSIVDAAKKYLGIPYVYGSNDPAKGLDCSSLVQRAYSDLGISLPRVAADQARQGAPIASMAQAKPGDLLAFGSPVDHIGIYAGNNKMVVAPKTGDVVKIQDVYTTPVAIRRVIPDGGIAAANSNTGPSAVSANLSSKYDALFTQAGTKYGISPNLLAAVAKQESGFNANATSGAGAQGLMQIMPATARGLGVNALDPTQAVDGAARMLSGLVEKFGSVELALAGYNAGPGAVQQYGGIPPYKETQNYVRNVMSLARTGGGL